VTAPQEAIEAAALAIHRLRCSHGNRGTCRHTSDLDYVLATDALEAAEPHWHCQSCDGHSCDEPAAP
jgi:hypothetical protein